MDLRLNRPYKDCIWVDFLSYMFIFPHECTKPFLWSNCKKQSFSDTLLDKLHRFVFYLIGSLHPYLSLTGLVCVSAYRTKIWVNWYRRLIVKDPFLGYKSIDHIISRTFFPIDMQLYILPLWFRCSIKISLIWRINDQKISFLNLTYYIFRFQTAYSISVSFQYVWN